MFINNKKLINAIITKILKGINTALDEKNESHAMNLGKLLTLVKTEKTYDKMIP